MNDREAFTKWYREKYTTYGGWDSVMAWEGWQAGVEHMRERENYLLFSPDYCKSNGEAEPGSEGWCLICKRYCKSVKEMQHHPDCRALGKEQP